MTDTKNELRKYCGDIANDLARLADNGFFYPEEEQEECGEENYFDDILDIKYILDADRELFAVCVCVAWGGPNIYIDTWDNVVKGYWGADKVEIPLADGVAEAIDDYFRGYVEF